MDENMELRKAPPKFMYVLAQLLEEGECWVKLMTMIRKDSDPTQFKYNFDHVRLIKDAHKVQGRTCAEIFLEEWGISGRVRPTVGLLLSLLQSMKHYRAASFIFNELYGVPLEIPESDRVTLDISEVEYLLTRNEVSSSTSELSDTQLQEALPEDHLSMLATQLEMNTSLLHVKYTDLKSITCDFCEILITEPGGRKLGTGAFGSVFLGIYPSQECVAVKKLNRDTINLTTQFRNEVECLSRFCHPNLLPLLGYSCDGPAYCLVYEYMKNGSLQDCLTTKAESLKYKARINIALGTAKGIEHLHTACEKPLIHRDIKSANILLDESMQPKLGDFGLIRHDSSSEESQSLTSNVIGTSAYMAPEAFYGDISVKLDTFSFGVVLLELLTGLPPCDEARETADLITHVQEACKGGSILPLLDMRAGTWSCEEEHMENTVADRIYSLSRSCLEEKCERPDMTSVLKHLEHIMELCV